MHRDAEILELVTALYGLEHLAAEAVQPLDDDGDGTSFAAQLTRQLEHGLVLGSVVAGALHDVGVFASDGPAVGASVAAAVLELRVERETFARLLLATDPHVDQTAIDHHRGRLSRASVLAHRHSLTNLCVSCRFITISWHDDTRLDRMKT